MTEIPVDRVDRLWPGMRRVVDTPAGSVVVFVEDDGFHAIANSCPHYGVEIDRGRVAHGYVSCPWHGWLIDIRTGDCMGIRKGVPTFPTTVRDGVLHLAVCQPAEEEAGAAAR